MRRDSTCDVNTTRSRSHSALVALRAALAGAACRPRRARSAPTQHPAATGKLSARPPRRRCGRPGACRRCSPGRGRARRSRARCSRRRSRPSDACVAVDERSGRRRWRPLGDHRARARVDRSSSSSRPPRSMRSGPTIASRTRSCPRRPTPGRPRRRRRRRPVLTTADVRGHLPAPRSLPQRAVTHLADLADAIVAAGVHADRRRARRRRLPIRHRCAFCRPGSRATARRRDRRARRARPSTAASATRRVTPATIPRSSPANVSRPARAAAACAVARRRPTRHRARRRARSRAGRFAAASARSSARCSPRATTTPRRCSLREIGFGANDRARPPPGTQRDRRDALTRLGVPTAGVAAPRRLGARAGDRVTCDALLARRRALAPAEVTRRSTGACRRGANRHPRASLPRRSARRPAPGQDRLVDGVVGLRRGRRRCRPSPASRSSRNGDFSTVRGRCSCRRTWRAGSAAYPGRRTAEGSRAGAARPPRFAPVPAHGEILRSNVPPDEDGPEARGRPRRTSGRQPAADVRELQELVVAYAQAGDGRPAQGPRPLRRLRSRRRAAHRHRRRASSRSACCARSRARRGSHFTGNWSWVPYVIVVVRLARRRRRSRGRWARRKRQEEA